MVRSVSDANPPPAPPDFPAGIPPAALVVDRKLAGFKDWVPSIVTTVPSSLTPAFPPHGCLQFYDGTLDAREPLQAFCSSVLNQHKRELVERFPEFRTAEWRMTVLPLHTAPYERGVKSN